MSSGTNQERIEQNNLKLAQLKTKADNLPEYQDIEPIYASENFSLLQTNLSYASNKYLVSNLDNKYISYYINDSNPYYHYIARVNADGTITNLFYRQNGSNGSLYNIELLDYDDDYLYIFDRQNNYGRQWNWKIQRFNLLTNTMESDTYWTVSVDASNWFNGEYSFNNLGNGYVQLTDYGYPIYKLDVKNKVRTIVKSPINQNTYSLMFNSNIIAANVTGTYTYIVLLNLLTKAELKVNVNAKTYNAILVSNDRVVINNNLYVLNENLTTGELIKENVIEGYVANATWLLNIYPSYYMECNRGILYYFNEDTNMFEKVLNTSGIMKQNSGCNLYNARICNVSNLYNIVKADNSDKIIGYKYDGITMMLPNGLSTSSDKLLVGSYLYNKFNVGVAGTMPNNGALNYTPSTSQQTIPAGYTSGGTVEPINLGVLPYSIDNISSSEVTNPGSYTYTFVQNANGYYESNNKGKDNSFAMCKLSFVVEETSNVSISYINSGEANYDFGIFSNLDTTLQANNNEDTSNVKKSCKSDSSTAIRTLTYSNVSVGEHFIYIKFRKDGSSSSGNDSLQFKLNITKTTAYIKNKIYASVEDMNNDTIQETNTYALIFDTNTFKMTEMYKWDGTKWIKTEELSPISAEDLEQAETLATNILS